MNGRDILQASIALMDWFDSQEIDNRKSVIVMGAAIAAIITSCPKEKRPILRDAFMNGLDNTIKQMGRDL